MAELTDEQLQRQNAVDAAIHGLFQEFFGFGVPWDIDKIAQVRETVQDAFGMTEEQCFEFYPWISDPSGFPEPMGEPADDPTGISESMDGDHATALRDAGMGVDEDYRPDAPEEF